MLIEPFLGRLVVIGRDRKNRLDSDGPDLAAPVNNLASAIPACAGNDRDFSPGLFDHDTDDVQVLIVLERRSFAGRPAGNEEINPFAQLKLHKTAERRNVERTVPAKRGHERRAATFNFEAHGASLRESKARVRAPPSITTAATPAETAPA